MRAPRLLAAAAALFIAVLPVRADQVLGPGRILGSDPANGDILFGALKLGKRQGGKTTLQPDALQIQGPGSTGDVSGMSVVSPATSLPLAISSILGNQEIGLPSCKRPEDPDWTLAFQRCQATGREIYIPPGNYTVGTGGNSVVIQPNTKIRGAGQAFVTIQLANGANTDVFVTAGAYNLFGTPAGASVDRWQISGVTIDGNKANQTATGSAIDHVNGIALYGCGWILSHVTINNVLGHGIRSEWQQYGEATNTLETTVQTVTIDTTGRHGWWFKGPHDAHVDTLTVIDASQEKDNTYDDVFADAKSNARWNDFHGWHRNAATNRVAFNFVSSGGNQITNSHFEGGRGWIDHRAQADSVSNSLFYGANNYPNTAGVIFRNAQNSHTGNNYVGRATDIPMYAFQFGDANGGFGYQETIVGGYANGFSAGLLNFVSDAGFNTINLTGGGNGSGAPYVGTPNGNTSIIYRDPVMQMTNFGGSPVAIGYRTKASQLLDIAAGNINLDYSYGIRVGSANAPTSEGGDNTWAAGTSKLIEQGFFNNLDTVRLYTPGTQNPNPRVTFQSNGNNGVGLGTAAAGAAWDVAGTMRGQMLTIGGAPSAANIPTSYWTVVKRTDDGSVKICANDNGTIKCAAMQ